MNNNGSHGSNKKNHFKAGFFITVGASLLPYCMNDKSKGFGNPARIFLIDSDQEKMIAALVSGTILPTTETPGAREVSAHLFVLKMVDDCFRQKDQQQFLQGMSDFEKQVREKNGTSFERCDQKQQQTIVAALDASKSTDAQSCFYRTVKRLTIQAYTSSEFFLTKVHIYKMIPGRFEGCVPLQNA